MAVPTSALNCDPQSMMNDDQPTNMRALTQSELSGVAGAAVSTVSVMAAVKLAAYLDSINFKFFGCTTSENGLTACSYSHDALPGDF